jgi:cytochrome P450
MINNYLDVVFAYGARDGIWPGIGTVLLKESGVVGDALFRAERVIKSRLGWSLLETLRSNGPMQEFMLEPMSTAVQLALTAAWDNRGIKPAAVLCRCGGEFAAVHAGGGLSFDDALDLACRVGSLIREGRGRGKMLHVRLSENETKNLGDVCPARFEVISDGSIDTTIIGCDANDVGIVGDFFSKHKVEHSVCQSSWAFHTWMVESWKEGMLRPLQQSPTTCSIPIYSATSQGRLASNVDWSLHFWRVVREPLSVRSAIRSALDDGSKCFLEIGGQPTLRDFILCEAYARNLHVHSFATMERFRSLHEVMNPTQAALTATAPRRSDVSPPALPASISSQTSVANIQIDMADPYPVYARLRRMGPALRLNWPGLGPTWVVTRYRDALTVFKDSRFVRNPVNSGRPARYNPIRGFGRDLLELDPPDHTRLRKLVSKAFTPQMVQRFDRRVTQLAGQILDHAKSRGEIELISEYASVIPITVISELLGVPINDIGKFRNFIYALTIPQMVGRSDSVLKAAKSRFTNDLHAIFAARRAAPQDDLVSSLVNLEHDCDRLSPDELIGMVYLLLVGGFVTTVNLIGNGILALLRHPEQLDMLRRNLALAETAVEELLRFDSPLKLSVICFASTEIELSGAQIPRGAPVRVLIASANRDDEQFPAPDTLDITRRRCQHISFGQGIHHCLGAPLARLEGRIALSMLIERLPNLRLGDPLHLKWLPDPVLRGLQQLPLRF